jgi:hypothetical protein
VRKRIGDGVKLMVDYNQALSVDEALARGRALDGEDIYWLEEPIRHDDYAGLSKLARELKVPIQIGENFSLPASMSVALDAQAADYVHAGSRTHRRRYRMARGRRNRAIAQHKDVLAFISGSERAPSSLRHRPVITSNMSIGQIFWSKSRL